MPMQTERTALVTGATDGVGRMVARQLGEAGVHVLVHGRDQPRGAGVVAEIRATGGSAEFLRADFASLSEVRGLAEAV
jgi:NAD(P)-dependent dehydrogenase (short-subunit alcohol dehydrogenase family)